MDQAGGDSTTVEVGVPTGCAEALGPRVLLVAHGPGGVQSVALGIEQPLLIGRRLPSDLLMGDASLSRRHARFAYNGERVTVQDVGSRNGTVVSGARIAKHVAVPVLVGQAVTLGSTTVVVHNMTSVGRIAGTAPSAEALMPLLTAELSRAQATDTTVALLAIRTLDRSAIVGGLPALHKALRPLDCTALTGRSRALALCPGCDGPRALALAQAVVSASDAPLGVGVTVAGGGPARALVLQAQQACVRTHERQRLQVVEATSGPAALAGSTRAVGRSGADLFAGQDGRDGQDGQDGQLVAVSPAMQLLLKRAQRAASAPVTVLVQGETGAGKEVVARYIHRQSSRATARLVTVNCGAIPETLLASTLFGHVRGAFTGASEARPGLFEQADGGTLFMDEVGELSLEAQVSLLRVLESGTLTRVGSSKEVTVDVRVIAATHRDLMKCVQEGRFREDLLYRLNVVTLEVAPLRHRPQDLVALTDVLLADVARRFEMPVPATTADSRALLAAYRFPGNVRELRNVLEHAMVHCEQGVLTPDALPPRLHNQAALDHQAQVTQRPVAMDAGRSGMDADSTLADGVMSGGVMSGPVSELVAADSHGGAHLPAAGQGPASEIPFRTRIEHMEIQLIREALRDCAGNQTKAAHALQIPRRTLVHKLRAYGLQGDVSL